MAPDVRLVPTAEIPPESGFVWGEAGSYLFWERPPLGDAGGAYLFPVLDPNWPRFDFAGIDVAPVSWLEVAVQGLWISDVAFAVCGA